jgi:hypothetical protein
MRDSMPSACDDAHDHPIDFEAARHVAAHAIAHLHMGQSFHSVGAHTAGWWEVIDPIWATDPRANARVALVGPCRDLAVDLVEENGDSTLVGSWLETWRDDVASNPQGYRHDMVAASGAVADAASWALAFCRVNLEMIDELATTLTKEQAPVDYAAIVARFHGRTHDIDPEALSAANHDFVGQTRPLDRIDEAVADYLNLRTTNV